MNSSINVQNNNWSKVKHHILRTFEDYKNGSHYDKNKNIDPNYSKYNLSTDGKIIQLPKYQNNKLKQVTRFVPFNKNIQRIHNQLVKKVNFQYSNFIKQHNQSKSVKKNPQRKYKNGFWYLFKRKGKAHEKQEIGRAEKSITQPFGDATTNKKLIKIIQQHNNWSYSRARNSYLKFISKALFKSELHAQYHYLFVNHIATNVDELINKHQDPDGVHLHESIIPVAFTTSKTHRPSTNINNALKLEYHTSNIKTAWQRFNNSRGKKIVRDISHALYNHYHIKQFKHITFSHTYSKHTGQTQEQYQYHQQQKHLAQKRKIKHLRRKKKIRHKHRRNAINRRRTYYRQYMRHYRSEQKLQKQSHQIKIQLIKNKHLSHLYILSIRDEKKILKTQKTKLHQNRLTLHKQQSLLAQLPKIIKNKKNELRSFTSTLIASTSQTLHQNAQTNISNLTAIRSANDKTISKANKQAQTGILGRIKSTFNQFKSNYISNSASKAKSQAQQSSYSLKIYSIASPIAERRERWDDAVNSLENKENHGGLYLNEHQQLESLQNNPPQTVAQYSNSIQNQTGMNLVQSSASSASSYAKAKPSIIASQKSVSASLSNERDNLLAKQKKTQQQAIMEENKRQKVEEHTREEIDKQQKRWIKTHPKEFIKKFNKYHQGPQI